MRACAQLPTRYRSYTCVHGLGHALLRAYHGDIGQAVRACRALQRAYAPDCAQGVFHDYWISLRGADGTTKPRGAISPRVLCDGRLTYVRPCWYRYFLEQPVSLPVRNAADLRRSCRGLHSIERFGCISAAALTISSNPFDQIGVCAQLRGEDAAACLRGVPDQALAGKPAGQLRLIRECGRIERAARRGLLRVAGANARRRHERSLPRTRVHEAGPGCAGCMCRRRAEDERRPGDVLLGVTGALVEDPRRRL